MSTGLIPMDEFTWLDRHPPVVSLVGFPKSTADPSAAQDRGLNSAGLGAAPAFEQEGPTSECFNLPFHW